MKKCMLIALISALLLSPIVYVITIWPEWYELTVNRSDIESLTLGGDLTLKDGTTYHTTAQWGSAWDVMYIDKSEKITFKALKIGE